MENIRAQLEGMVKLMAYVLPDEEDRKYLAEEGENLVAALLRAADTDPEFRKRLKAVIKLNK